MWKWVVLLFVQLFFLSTSAFAQNVSQAAPPQTATPRPATNWLENYVNAMGGCGSRSLFGGQGLTNIRSNVARGDVNADMFGRPALGWTDDDITTAARIYRDCETKIRAEAIKTCMRGVRYYEGGTTRGSQNRPVYNDQSTCERNNPDYSSTQPKMESQLREIVVIARKLDDQRRAQQQAKIEQETAQAESRRAQAEEETQQKEKELREQAKRDKEAAEEARRFAEREEPKIAEATKEAEEARRARQEAEQHLAEIRSRIDSQEKVRQKADTETQALEKQAELDKRTSGYQRISVETFLLDGGELAFKEARVSLTGVYIHKGNLDVLYADRRALMMGTQPEVTLLTDDASREFRQLLLACQSNPASTQVGCPFTVLGRATKCTLSNAFGVKRVEPCVTVEKGWQ